MNLSTILWISFPQVDQGILFDLVLAANYLDIQALLDVTCKIVANMMNGKTPEEIRKTFNIYNDFSPAEEAQIAMENTWCEVKKSNRDEWKQNQSQFIFITNS